MKESLSSIMHCVLSEKIEHKGQTMTGYQALACVLEDLASNGNHEARRILNKYRAKVEGYVV
jgi:hypothetical protein